MAFRYEIWNYTEEIFNKNKSYYITSYSKYCDVTPNDNSFSLSIEKELPYEFYRVRAGGELVFNGADFQTLFDISVDCTPHVLLVFDDCSATRSDFIKDNFWNTADYIGFINKRTIVFDHDRCLARLTPQTFDLYTGFLSTLKNEYNLFDIVERVPVTTESSVTIGEYPVESASSTFRSDTMVDIADYDIIDDISSPFWDLFKKGLLVNYIIINEWIRTVPENEYIWDGYKYTMTYKREYTYNDSDTIPPDPTTGWEYDSYQQGIGKHKWVRTPIGITTPAYKLIHEEYYPVEGWKKIYEITNNLFAPRIRGMVLKDVITSMISQNLYRAASPSSDTFQLSSYFLNSYSNPITGNPDEYTNLILMQASDARPTVDEATIAKSSLDAILSGLEFLKLTWYLTYNQTTDKPVLHIEHREFFLNGLNYTTPTFFYDVLEDDSRGVLGHDSEEPPSREKITLSYSYLRDFTGVPIKYPIGCSTEDEKEYSFNIITDITPYIIDNENAPNEGLLLLHTKKKSGIIEIDGEPFQTIYYEIQNTSAELANVDIINAKLSISNVISNLWTFAAPAWRGMVNDLAYITFNSIRKQVVQNRVNIRLNYKEINPMLLVRNNRPYISSGGQIKVANFNTRNRKWEATILYE